MNQRPSADHYSYATYADPETARTFDDKRFGGPIGELVAAMQARALTNMVGRITGRPILDSTRQTGASRGNTENICPSLEGGKSPVSAASYSPRTGWFYVSTNNLCMDFSSTPSARIAATPPASSSRPRSRSAPRTRSSPRPTRSARPRTAPR